VPCGGRWFTGPWGQVRTPIADTPHAGAKKDDLRPVIVTLLYELISATYLSSS